MGEGAAHTLHIAPSLTFPRLPYGRLPDLSLCSTELPARAWNSYDDYPAVRLALLAVHPAPRCHSLTNAAGYCDSAATGTQAGPQQDT